jgi:hypothetical protein
LKLLRETRFFECPSEANLSACYVDQPISGIPSSVMVQGQWKRVLDAEDIKRSSQALSVVGDRAYIFGGELRPREPVDRDIHVVKLNAGK